MPTPSSAVVPRDLQARIEREIEAFDEFFIRPVSAGGAGNQEALLPFEKAVLRTYLFSRHMGLFSPPEENRTSQPEGA